MKVGCNTDLSAYNAVITFRATPKGKSRGELVAIEFVPADFRLMTDEEARSASVIIYQQQQPPPPTTPPPTEAQEPPTQPTTRLPPPPPKVVDVRMPGEASTGSITETHQNPKLSCRTSDPANQLTKPRILAQRRQIRIVFKAGFVFISQRG